MMRWLKRATIPSWYPIPRKTKKYLVVPRGSHKKEEPIALLPLVRDIFKLAETSAEARKVIKGGDIEVDGRKRKDIHHAIGAFDIIAIPKIGKYWRAIPKNGLSFVEIGEDESKLKIVKVRDRRVLRGKKTQINLSDGRNILSDKECSSGDSLLLQLPEQKIVDHLKLDKGAAVMILSGKMQGGICKIDTIEKNNSRAWVHTGKERFEVPLDKLVVVGKEKPLIKLE